jgi:hypothetical protein
VRRRDLGGTSAGRAWAPRERVPGGGEGQVKVKVKVKGVAPCAAEMWVAPLPGSPESCMATA